MSLTKSSVLRIVTVAPTETPRNGDGIYLIRFWLPILGPTTTILRLVLLDELGQHGTLSPDGELERVLIVGDLCDLLGVTYPNIVDNALRRGREHGYWTCDDNDVWQVPAQVPTVPARWVRKQGNAFAACHDAYPARLGVSQ